MKLNFENLMIFILIACAYLIFFKQVFWAFALIISAFVFYSTMRLIIYFAPKPKPRYARITKIHPKKYKQAA